MEVTAARISFSYSESWGHRRSHLPFIQCQSTSTAHKDHSMIAIPQLHHSHNHGLVSSSYSASTSAGQPTQINCQGLRIRGIPPPTQIPLCIPPCVYYNLADRQISCHSLLTNVELCRMDISDEKPAATQRLLCH